MKGVKYAGADLVPIEPQTQPSAHHNRAPGSDLEHPEDIINRRSPANRNEVVQISSPTHVAFWRISFR